MRKQCEIDGCDGRLLARGWCSKHWQRWKAHGDPTVILTGHGLGYVDRFWRFVDRTPTCWLWTGHTSGTYAKYGMFEHRGSHVIAYELLVGPIPDGLEIDHTCEVKTCVNPAHLDPVTHAENMRRMAERNALAGRREADPRTQARHAVAALSAGTRNGRAGS